MSWKNIFQKKPNTQKVDKKMWRDIFLIKGAAKKMLVNLVVQNEKGEPCKVDNVTLANGKIIPVADVTDEQAQEFLKKIAPDWAFKD